MNCCCGWKHSCLQTLPPISRIKICFHKLLLTKLVWASHSRHEGSNATCIRSQESCDGWRKDEARLGQCFVFLSVFWHCWVGDRKDNQPSDSLCHLSQRTPRVNQLARFHLQSSHHNAETIKLLSLLTMTLRYKTSKKLLKDATVLLLTEGCFAPH